MEFDRAQLKQSVKLSMKGTDPKPMLVTLACTAIISAGTWLINTVLGWLLTGGVGNVSETVLNYIQQGYEVEEAVYIAMLELFRMGPGAMFGAVVGGGVLSLIVSLWGGTMNVGYEGYCLSMVRNENPPLGRIFCALPQIGPVLITRILTVLFIFLWSLLAYVGIFAFLVILSLAAIMDVPALAVLLTLLVGIGLVLGMIWVTLRYALVDYVLLDKGLSGMDAIRESKRLMKGNAGRAFVLQLSFIGWYLLIFVIVYGGIIAALVPIISAYTSGGGWIAASGFALVIIIAVTIAAVVLTLWLRPYTTGAMAKFYEWAKGSADGFTGGPGCVGGNGGWGQTTDYTWTSGTSSGTGMGAGPRDGGAAPKPPKPKDDPWN